MQWREKKSNLVSCQIINALCKWVSPLAMIYLSTCNRLVSCVKCILEVCLDQVDLQGCLVKLLLILLIKMGSLTYCVNDTILWARCSGLWKNWESKPSTGTHSLLLHFWLLLEDLIQPVLFLASVDFSVRSVTCKYKFLKKFSFRCLLLEYFDLSNRKQN